MAEIYRLHNGTSHALDILDVHGTTHHLPPRPRPVRRTERRKPAGILECAAEGQFFTVATETSAWEAVSGLPGDLLAGDIVIVSALIAEAVAAAVPPGVLVCRPGDPVRGPDGQPIACHGLVLVSRD